MIKEKKEKLDANKIRTKELDANEIAPKESILREMFSDNNDLNEKTIAGFIGLVMVFIVIMFICGIVVLSHKEPNILVTVVGYLLVFTASALCISMGQNLMKGKNIFNLKKEGLSKELLEKIDKFIDGKKK